MALDEFLDHTCDIYHGQEADDSPGFGLKSGVKLTYGDQPSETGIRCHFSVKTDSTAVIIGDSYKELDGKIKLTLPPGTDIRLNDRVVWKETGLAYVAEYPRDIRGHHLTAKLNREDGTKGAL